MSAPIQFNAVVFEEAIHRQFAGEVMGYAFVTADEHDLQAKVSGGYAQAPGDGNVFMKTHTYNNLGSVSKMLSGIALLHLFNEHKLADITVQEQLDMKIWHKLPPKWHSLIPVANKAVSYRHLLQHKSGILDTDPPAGSPYEGQKIFYMIREIHSTGAGNSRVYSNFHFAILTDLIAAIAYPQEYAQRHQEFNHLELFEYSRKMRQATGELFARYMREEIFPKSFGEIKPSCDPSNELPDERIAKMYAGPTDTKGWIYSEKATNGSCRGQGGYYMSAQDLANFARTFAFTDRYIGPTTRNSLYIPTSADKDNRLVYSELIDHPGFKEELNQLWWPWKCGEQGNANKDSASAALVQLPYNHFGVGVVNSKKACGDLARGIIDAFYDATRGQPITLAKHGMPADQYQKYVTELGKHGSYPDWLDFYTVNADVYVNAIWRPAPTADWVVRHGLTSSEYQALVNELVVHGPYRLKQIDSYVQDGQINYAVVLVKGSSANMPAYHGVTTENHQQRFDNLTAQGFVPVNIAITSLGGRRFYAAFYVQKPGADLVVRSILTASQYQTFVDEQRGAGRHITYLHTYNHNGEIFYSAIFEGNRNRPQILRHDLSSAAYQQEFNEWVGKGFAPTMVTGAANGNHHMYAAVWQ